MCRHLAYVGPPEPIGRILFQPSHGLYRQSWAPRHQHHGTVNADGFGIGWYPDGDARPARCRRSGPIWADLSLTDLARAIRTTALLAAVRDATLPGADAEAAAAPFTADTWLFSHHGAVTGWLAGILGRPRGNTAAGGPAVLGSPQRLGTGVGAGPGPVARR